MVSSLIARQWVRPLTIFCVHTSFAIILMGKRERVDCSALFAFLMSRDCCVTPHRDATGLSAVFDCGIS